LLYLAFMEVNAGTEHYPNITRLGVGVEGAVLRASKKFLVSCLDIQVGRVQV
jgi:hypothetical protein